MLRIPVLHHHSSVSYSWQNLVLFQEQMLTVSTENVEHSFLSGDIYILKTSLLRLAKPASFFGCYGITLPPCSAVLLCFWCAVAFPSNRAKLSSQGPPVHVSWCLPFLHSFISLSQGSRTQAMQVVPLLENCFMPATFLKVFFFNLLNLIVAV